MLCRVWGGVERISPQPCAQRYYQIDLVRPGAEGTGLVLQQTKHTYLERQCDCGHWTRAEPGRCGEEADWTVALTEWHLAGPTLVTFIVALTQRMRLSRARVQEFLHDWLGPAILNEGQISGQSGRSSGQSGAEMGSIGGGDRGGDNVGDASVGWGVLKCNG